MSLQQQQVTKTPGGEMQGDVNAGLTAAAKHKNLLGCFLATDEFLCRNILVFLSTNDVTILGMASKQLCSIVHSSRSSSYPCIIWEARRPTKIGYERISEHAEIVTVVQLHHFCFTIRTASQEHIQVDYSLINAVWDEHDNMRDGRRCRDLDSFPFDTRPSIAIIRPRTANQERHRLFVTQPPSCDIADGEIDDAYWMTFLGNDRNYIRNDMDWTPGEVQDRRGAMDMVWKCAQRIAAYPDGTVYPSAEYLMHKLPRWLHTYFPASFNLVAATAAVVPIHDRNKTVPEFTYRPARTLAEWDNIMPPMYDGIYEYDFHEIAWYREGYSWVTCNHSDCEQEDSWMSLEDDDDQNDGDY